EDVRVLNGRGPGVVASLDAGQPIRITAASTLAKRRRFSLRRSRGLRSFGDSACMRIERPTFVERGEVNCVAIDGDVIERQTRWLHILVGCLRQCGRKFLIIEGWAPFARLGINDDVFAGSLWQVDAIPESLVVREPVRID